MGRKHRDEEWRKIWNVKKIKQRFQYVDRKNVPLRNSAGVNVRGMVSTKLGFVTALCFRMNIWSTLVYDQAKESKDIIMIQ